MRIWLRFRQASVAKDPVSAEKPIRRRRRCTAPQAKQEGVKTSVEGAIAAMRTDAAAGAAADSLRPGFEVRSPVPLTGRSRRASRSGGRLLRRRR